MVYGASESWSSSVSEGEEEEEEGGKREKREIMTVGGGDLCPRFLVLGRACFACLLGGGKKVTQWVGGRPLPPGSSCGSWGKEAASASASAALAAVIIIFLMFMIPGGVKRERERERDLALVWRGRIGGAKTRQGGMPLKKPCMGMAHPYTEGESVCSGGFLMGESGVWCGK